MLSLVGMPFASLGSDPAQAQFAQGLSHTGATDLSRISGLTVIASTTAASLDGRDQGRAAAGPPRPAGRGVLDHPRIRAPAPAALPEAAACFERAQVANPRLPRARVGAAVALALSGDDAGARRACAELLALVPRYRRSRSMDGCRETTAPAYRQFYKAVLAPGTVRAGILV
jgi:Flp pilus assembly protein TadD